MKYTETSVMFKIKLTNQKPPTPPTLIGRLLNVTKRIFLDSRKFLRILLLLFKFRDRTLRTGGRLCLGNERNVMIEAQELSKSIRKPAT